MNIEVWSDIICPWCYIGKRRLEQALAQFEGRGDVSITWRSYELDAHAPRQHPGTLNELLASKYEVSPEEAASMNERVSRMAAEVGLAYRLDMARPGNTFDAHRLLHFARSRGTGDAATERLMHAYFCEGLPVGERTALARLAPEFGIPEQEALSLLESDAWSQEVRADEARAGELGITGVPFFVFAGKLGVSGAQPLHLMLDALRQAALPDRPAPAGFP